MPRGTLKIPILTEPGGVREDVNPAAIPPGSWGSATNWITRQGIGRVRPGYEAFGTQVTSADRITGIGFRGSHLVESNLLVHTLTKAYRWTGSAWADKTEIGRASCRERV